MSSLNDKAPGAPRFGVASQNSGTGAPWNPRGGPATSALPPPLPGAQPRLEANWAQQALQLAQDPQAQGRFGGRSLAQWQRIAEREAGLDEQPAGVVLHTAHQAAELLGSQAPAEARDIVSGTLTQPTEDQWQICRRSLAQLATERPASFRAVCRALTHAYGGAAASLYDLSVAAPQPLPAANRVTPQATQAAKILATELGDLPVDPALLSTAQGVVCGTAPPPGAAEWAALACCLMLLRVHRVAAYRRILTSLRATYGAAASTAVEAQLTAAPFEWQPPSPQMSAEAGPASTPEFSAAMAADEPTVVSAQPAACWINTDTHQACTATDLLSYWSARRWPS